MKKALYTILIILLVAVFGVSAFQVGRYFLESREQANRFNDLSAMVQSAREAAATETTPASGETKPQNTDGSAEPAESTEPAEKTILPWYQDLYEMNPDLVGWIKIEGTKIDYPVMQTSVDNKDYYLRRNFDKETSSQGCIYVREECDVFAPSDNLTIYGHNMKDGSMFACLHDYQKKSAWENNNLIFFDTLYEYHVYQIFAVFKTTTSIGEGFSYHQMVDANSEEDFNEFIANCKELALYETGITPVYGDKIICLSTCEYTQTNGRLVVAAVRIT